MDPSLDAVLPAGVVRAAGAPPPPPADFGDGYVLPEHCEKPLQLLHTHPLDARLRFYEKPHVYTFDGVPTSISVTAMAHAYEKPFVAASAIASMKTSRAQAWPRLEYVVGATECDDADWTPDKGALLACGGKTVAVVHPHSLAPGADLRGMLEAARVKGGTDDADDETLHVFERAMTDREIADGWARKGKLASHQGTEAHYLAECFFNGLPVRWWEGEMAVVLDLAREHMLPKGMVSYKTEWEIVCADADLAGSIDLVVWDPSRQVHHIVDFKRSDKLRRDLRGYGKMAGALSHLDDCKGAGYALQTSIYQCILERDYGMTLGDRVLLSIHPDEPFCTSVPYLRTEVEFLMANRIARVRARRALAAEDPARFACALTGAPCVDAVRLADGTRVMEKAAQVQERRYTVDREARAAFEAAVEARVEPVPMGTEGIVSWRKRMPEGGLRPFA